jgi:hypothetical protein
MYDCLFQKLSNRKELMKPMNIKVQKKIAVLCLECYKSDIVYPGTQRKEVLT